MKNRKTLSLLLAVTMAVALLAAPAYTQVSKEDYSAVKKLIGRMEGVLRYEHHVSQGFTDYWRYLDYFAVSAEMPENYQAPLDFVQPALDHAGTARALKFLCAAADIPCFTVSSKTHTWNLVYVDGQWLHVDVSANDLSGRNGILLAESYQTGKDQAPEATAFLKELFVPGSTK